MTDRAQQENQAPGTETTDNARVSRVPAPPAQAHIPVAPAGFVPMLGKDFFGVPPRTVHMAALPDVVGELARSDDFAEVFGKTAPPRELTLEIVEAAFLWSHQRAQMRAWDLYCRTQEGLAWRELRALMRRVGPAYESATMTDSTVAARYSALGRLLNGTRPSARKAAETRRTKRKAKEASEATGTGEPSRK